MDQQLQNALNAGLGLYRTAEEKFQGLREQIEQGYTELVAKGGTDQSENAGKLREILNQGLSQVKDLQGKVEAALKN